jgi:OOP family OmpA-OmpF porin
MFKKIAAAAILATLAASSFAATPGFYAGVDTGSTKADDISGHETSFGAVLGYNLNPNFALEAGYRRLGSWDAGNTSVKVDQTALSVIGKVPLANQFNIYGRLGYNYLDASARVSGVTISDNESKVLLGVGVGYDFAPNLAARLEVQKPDSHATNVSVGVLYSF